MAVLILIFNTFYPRPVLTFGYCRCLRVCVRVSVRQSSACPCNNSSTVQARITKFGPEMEKTLVKIPIILWDDWPWTSRSNRTQKSKFTPFWACPCEKSPPIEVSISKFGPKMHLSTVKVPIDLGLDWPWCSVSFLISNMFILPKFASHYSFASVCIYSVRPSLMSAAHSTWHRTYTDSFMHADSVAPWTVKPSSFISWLDRRSSMSRRLGDWHWILQAPIGSCQMIHTSHAVILYASIRQSQKQQ